MRKETAAELSHLQNYNAQLKAQLAKALENLNFYKDQNASLQTIIGQLEARLQTLETREVVWGQFVPHIEAPEVSELPPLTDVDL